MEMSRYIFGKKDGSYTQSAYDKAAGDALAEQRPYTAKELMILDDLNELQLKKEQVQLKKEQVMKELKKIKAEYIVYSRVLEVTESTIKQIKAELAIQGGRKRRATKKK